MWDDALRPVSAVSVKTQYGNSRFRLVSNLERGLSDGSFSQQESVHENPLIRV